MEAGTSLSEKQRVWLRHVRACAVAGISMRAYAAKHGLRVQAFYAAKAELRRSGVLDGARAHTEPPRFAKAQVVEACAIGRCRIVLPSGLTVELDAGTDPAWVAQLVGALA
jgi:hypothetical protein